jgi:hypothetical protein
VNGGHLVIPKSVLEKGLSDLGSIGRQVGKMLHDISSLLLNSKIEYVCTAFELQVGQVLQLYIKPVKGSYIVVCDGKN